MLLDLTVSESIDINVSLSKMWEVLTNPEIIKEYLFGTKTTTDWQVGSSISFEGSYNGTTYQDKGIVKENVPDEKLSYSYWSSFTGLEDEPETYALVTYTLKKVDDSKTNFTWTQTGFVSEQGYEHSSKGMTEFLENIKKIAEK